MTRSQVLYSNPGREGLVLLLALGALGLAMLAFIAAGPWIIARFDYAASVPGVVASGALTVAATMLAPNVPTRAGLMLILGLAVVMRLLVITDDPFLSTDIYRYVWDGRVQAAGINPHALVPADPALAALRDAAIYPDINRADYAVTAYPPVAQAFFLAVTRISETVVMMRLALVACEAVIVAVMIDLLRQRQRQLRLPPSDIAVLLMAGMFALSPNYPWYVLVVVPFVVLGGGAPSWAMTMAAPLLYKPLILPDNDLAWKTLALLPFVIAVAFTLLRGGQHAQDQGASRWTS